MNKQTKQWLKYLNWVQCKWQDLLRWFLGTRYNPPRIWHYGPYQIWYDDEAFIQLYMKLSKGGCKDFTEEVCYIEDADTMDDDSYTKSYSRLEFKNRVVWGVSNMIEKNI